MGRLRDGLEWTVDAMLDFLEWLWGFLVVIALVGAIVGAALWGMFTVDRVKCRQSAARLGTEHRFDIPSGCYYRIDGRWIPAGSYRAPENIDR